MMHSVVYHPGGGLAIEDVPLPEIGIDEVLIKVANTGFCGSDHSLIESGLLPVGFILGHETSGVLVEKGTSAAGPPVGTRVIIRPTYCGKCRFCLAGKPHLCQGDRRTIGVGDLPGGLAEYVKAYPQMLIPVPAGVNSRHAALAETFAAALHGIKCSGSTGGSVLVIGGGPIGLAAIQLLKLNGFSPLVLSEPVEEKRRLGLAFGADGTIDPFTDDIAGKVADYTAGFGFDTVLECSGVAGNIQVAIDLAGKGGAVCIVSVIFSNAAIKPMTINFKEIRVTGSISNTHEENIQCLKWMQSGQIDPGPLITDLIPLHQLPRTYRERIHAGRAVKVVVQIGDEF